MSARLPTAAQPMADLQAMARLAGGTLRGANASVARVTTDSREIQPGDLFVALEGERFDGHDYVQRALELGASGVLVAREIPGASRQVVVDDTRLALGRMAAGWRARFALPLVALTGSNGKTTVKEMLAAILRTHAGSVDAVLATEGNLNNDIGMPLTLLKLRGSHRYAVIEMGMNHEGEIDYLTRLAQPSVALVNNAQRAHVGILGSVEAIARAKGEIYAGLSATGIAVVNDDDAFVGYWRGLNTGRRVVSFGLQPRATVHATREGAQARITTPTGSFPVALQVAGEHNLRNAAAACAGAHALEIPLEAMRDALAAFTGVPGRLQRRLAKEGGGWVIDDSYNANPESMKAAIDVLAAEPGRRVFVMGDMGEMGEQSDALHAEIGAHARARKLDALYTLGRASRHAAQAFGPGAQAFDDVEPLIAAARRDSVAGATVLVKGSRFMKMERVADALATEDRDAA